MQGNVLGLFSEEGMAINGAEKEYEIASGQTIEKGDFVSLDSNNRLIKVSSSSDSIVGVALESGTAGETIKVVVSQQSISVNAPTVTITSNGYTGFTIKVSSSDSDIDHATLYYRLPNSKGTASSYTSVNVSVGTETSLSCSYGGTAYAYATITNIYGTTSSNSSTSNGTNSYYLIKFYPNGGSYSSSSGYSSISKYYNKSVTLSPSSKPKYDGYDLAGWATSSSATTATYTNGQTYSTNASLTLYAVWEEAATYYTLTLHGNGGIFGSSYNKEVISFSGGLVTGKRNLNNIKSFMKILTNGKYDHGDWYDESFTTEIYSILGTCLTSSGYWNSNRNYIGTGDLDVYIKWLKNATVSGTFTSKIYDISNSLIDSKTYTFTDFLAHNKDSYEGYDISNSGIAKALSFEGILSNPITTGFAVEYSEDYESRTYPLKLYSCSSTSTGWSSNSNCDGATMSAGNTLNNDDGTKYGSVYNTVTITSCTVNE